MYVKSYVKSALVSVIFLLLLGACDDGQPALERLSGGAVILAFGDSLTYGTGAGRSESYPAILERLTGHKVINSGISGEVSEQGLRRLPDALEKHRPQLLILCHGGNDLLRRKKGLANMKTNVHNMIRLAKDKNIQVVLLGVPKPGLFLSSYEGYTEIAESTGVVFIEKVIPKVLSKKGLKSDAIHPNAAGYKVIAETIHSVLKEKGAI